MLLCQRKGRTEMSFGRFGRHVSTQAPAAVRSTFRKLPHMQMHGLRIIRHGHQTEHQTCAADLPQASAWLLLPVQLFEEKIVFGRCVCVGGGGLFEVRSFCVLYVSTRALLNQCLPTIQIWRKEIHTAVTNVMDSWYIVKLLASQIMGKAHTADKQLIQIRYLHSIIRLVTRVDHAHSVILSKGSELCHLQLHYHCSDL